MESQNDQLEALQEIKSIMEKSSKFISLSGLSGVFIGIVALIGAAVAYVLLLNDPSRSYFVSVYSGRGVLEAQTVLYILLDAVGVLVISVLIGYFLTKKKADTTGQKMFDHVGKRMFMSMIIPLITGGLVCLILLYYGMAFLLAPLTLIFYGLSLINGSYYTLKEIKYLGVSEVILGLVALLAIGHGILFWAIGFGILHIVYGVYMHNKYDRK